MMGGLISYLFPGEAKGGAEYESNPSLDIVDEKTGLTQRQKYVIRENWTIIEKDIRGNGVDLFIAFFIAHPNHQKQFKPFADMPIEELKHSRKLQAHAYGVMHAISSFVENLNDIDCLLELLQKTGRDHIRRNVTIEPFNRLAVVFVDFMNTKLGDTFTPFARITWNKAFEVINSVIDQGLHSKAS